MRGATREHTPFESTPRSHATRDHLDTPACIRLRDHLPPRDAQERVTTLREELEEQCRREVKAVQNEMRARRAESTTLVETELQAAEVERETLERKAKELLQRAKEEKRDVEKQAEAAMEQVEPYP